MAFLQGALPNVSPASSLLSTSSLGTQSLGLMAPQSPSYASAVPPPHSPSFVSAMPPGKFTLFIFISSEHLFFIGRSFCYVQFNNLRCIHGATST
jgi:hypothetical protein